MDITSLNARLWGLPENMGGEFLALILSAFVWLFLAVVFGFPMAYRAPDARR